MTPGTDGDDVQFIVIVKGLEKYVIVHSLRQRQEAMRVLDRWAENPSLSLTADDVDMAATENPG